MQSLKFASKLEEVMSTYNRLLGETFQLTELYKEFLLKEGYSNETVESLLNASRITLNSEISHDEVFTNIVSANELNKNLEWYKKLEEKLAIVDIAFVPEDMRIRGYLFRNPTLVARNEYFFIGGNPVVGVFAKDVCHCETAQFLSEGDLKGIKPGEFPLTERFEIENYLRNDEFDERVIRAAIDFDKYSLLPSGMDHPYNKFVGKVVLLPDLTPKCTA
jgi:hypothetical protein